MSEKVVCQIMKEEGLIAKHPSKRKYSSCKGEIGEAPENIVKRDFHADGPNRLWLTDITEFSIPSGKVYLSLIIDCFDGMRVAWMKSISPNAELVNSMLYAAASKLPEGEHPVSHSDRGCHYRWPGWIERCKRYGITRSMLKKGWLSRQLRDGRVLRVAQGRVPLWPRLVGMVDSWFHGCSR